MKNFLILLFLLPITYATIFDMPIIPKEINITVVEKNITPTPLCVLGFTQFCNITYVNHTITIKNDYVDHPFTDKVRVVNGWLDIEDLYTMYTLNLTPLYICSSKSSDLLGVYSCSKQYIHEHRLNCRLAASVMKLALLHSHSYKNLKGSGIHVYKAFSYDGNVTSHRFLLLKNENGYYVLDPQQCNSISDEYCIYIHTKGFYDIPSSINYRKHVYLLERII